MLYLNALKRHTFVLPPTKGFVIVYDEFGEIQERSDRLKSKPVRSSQDLCKLKAIFGYFDINLVDVIYR